MEDNTRHDAFAALRIPEFRNLMIGRFAFIMGLRIMATLLGWWIYELTNAPFAIGLIGLSKVISVISLALYAGHVIDISEKRKLLLTCISLYLVAAILLTLLSTHFTATVLHNHVIAAIIYIIVFGTGIIRSFTGPTFSSLLGHIVPKKIIVNATTWSQGTWLSVSVTGHATAGVLIAGFGNTGTLLAVIILVSIALSVLFLLKAKPPLNERGEKRTWESVKEGLHFIYRTKELLSAITLDLFAVFFGGAVAMIPVYARDILKVGPEGFGFLNGASDLGSICIVIWLTLFPLRKQQGRKLLIAGGLFGACIIVFALSKVFWLSFIALLISGIVDGVCVVVRGTLMQLKTPDNMRGRVLSVSSMFVNSSNDLGQFESGMAAKLMGVVPSVLFGGCMTLLVVIVTWVKVTVLRKMEY
jgi:MFS family permease